MSDRPVLCLCPRPTAGIEEALVRIRDFEATTVMTNEMRTVKEGLLRQLALARAGSKPSVCPVCRGRSVAFLQHREGVDDE